MSTLHVPWYSGNLQVPGRTGFRHVRVAGLGRFRDWGSRVLSCVWQGLGFSGDLQVAVKIKVLRAIKYLVPHYGNYRLNLVPQERP